MQDADAAEDAVEGFLKGGAGAGEVDADEMVVAVHGAAVDPHLLFLEQEILQFRSRHAQRINVHPGQVGGLQGSDYAGGGFGRETLLQVAEIIVHVGVHLVQPDGAFRAVGRFQGHGGELAEVAMLPIVQHPVQFLARGLIRTNHIRDAKAGDVEGFGRGDETDAMLRYFFRQ